MDGRKTGRLYRTLPKQVGQKYSMAIIICVIYTHNSTFSKSLPRKRALLHRIYLAIRQGFPLSRMATNN